MMIHGLNKTTLLDYPGLVAATVFTGGCNFRCPFCQNASLVLNPGGEPSVSEEEFFSFLNKRKNILKGVCVTGGEPTLDPDLIPFISKIKDLGFFVKLDTNGSNPGILKTLLDRQLLDMVAMDIKSGLSDYALLSGVSNPNLTAISESVRLLMSGSIDYEFRTTVVKELFRNESFHEIGSWLRGAKAYYLQCFRDSEMVLSQGLSSPTKEELLRYQQIVSSYIPNTQLRGVD